MADWRVLCRDEGWVVDGQRFRVPLANERGHWVTVVEDGDYIDLNARVAIPRRLEVVEDPELVVWRRNARVKLVSFQVDQRGVVVGRVRVARVGLSREELRLSVHSLANECDRMEHLLTGVDVE